MISMDNIPMPIEAPQIGDVVIYTSPDNVDFYGLVIHVYMQVGLDWRKKLINVPCVNVVITSPNPDDVDCCGRTIEHVLHVIHMTGRQTNANYWRWPNEKKELR